MRSHTISRPATNAPLVSVIMPVFNMRRTLRDAVLSVIGQSVGDFELIIIDDASTDGSFEEALCLLERDKRICLLRSVENSRSAVTEWEPRNDGIIASRGKYIAYLDADNEWRSEFIEKMSLVMEREPSVMLAFCHSCNHYSPAERDHVVAADGRCLQESGPTWTVFAAPTTVRPEELGVSHYVDTNEIMHRRNMFPVGDTYWRVKHPRRAEINVTQVPRRPHRRHNDLDLVQRAFEAYGITGIFHLREVLVDYYYPSACRRAEGSWRGIA